MTDGRCPALSIPSRRPSRGPSLGSQVVLCQRTSESALEATEAEHETALAEFCTVLGGPADDLVVGRSGIPQLAADVELLRDLATVFLEGPGIDATVVADAREPIRITVKLGHPCLDLVGQPCVVRPFDPFLTVSGHGASVHVGGPFVHHPSIAPMAR